MEKAAVETGLRAVGIDRVVIYPALVRTLQPVVGAGNAWQAAAFVCVLAANAGSPVVFQRGELDDFIGWGRHTGDRIIAHLAVDEVGAPLAHPNVCLITYAVRRLGKQNHIEASANMAALAGVLGFDVGAGAGSLATPAPADEPATQLEAALDEAQAEGGELIDEELLAEWALHRSPPSEREMRELERLVARFGPQHVLRAIGEGANFAHANSPVAYLRATCKNMVDAPPARASAARKCTPSKRPTEEAASARVHIPDALKNARTSVGRAAIEAKITEYAQRAEGGNDYVRQYAADKIKKLQELLAEAAEMEPLPDDQYEEEELLF